MKRGGQGGGLEGGRAWEAGVSKYKLYLLYKYICYINIKIFAINKYIKYKQIQAINR